MVEDVQSNLIENGSAVSPEIIHQQGAHMNGSAISAIAYKNCSSNDNSSNLSSSNHNHNNSTKNCSSNSCANSTNDVCCNNGPSIIISTSCSPEDAFLEAAAPSSGPSPEDFEPPDGGSRAWLILIGSFFCNGILFGVINSYSVFYAEFYDNMLKRNVENPSSKAALVGSLAMGTTFFISPVSGLLTDYIGLRKTTFLGGLIASGGMFLSSFCVDSVLGLCITFGIMYGLGGALAYTPSLTILGHYFKKYLGIVNGAVTAGSSAFTVVMPYVIDGLLKSCGLVWTLRALSLIASMIMACAIFYKPVQNKPSIQRNQSTKQSPELKSKRKRISAGQVFNLSLWRNKKYLVWAGVIALSLFGYFVPYVYMLKFVQANFPPTVDGKLPVLCIGISSGVGRLVFGYIADFPKVNRILLQQLAFFSIGVLTMLLPFSTGSFTMLIFLALGMGLFDGCFISLLGPIAFDICGQNGAAQAIGFLLGMCSLPLTVGPYVAGEIFESQQSYTLPLILAGIPPAVGSLLMFVIRLVKNPDKGAKEDPATLACLKNSKDCCQARTNNGQDVAFQDGTCIQAMGFWEPIPDRSSIS